MLPFRSGTPQEFAAVRMLLERVGYTEAEIVRRFELPAIQAFRTIPEGRAPETELRDAVDVLVRLFMDAQPVDRELVRSTLSDAGVAALEALRLLVPADADAYQATVLLYPTEGLYIASDPPVADESGSQPALDIVFAAITRHTAMFLAMLSDQPCDSFLELCSGTGIAALIAAKRFARHAWAVDITERSTRFAEFNARLNAVENITVLQGDLYEPLRGLTFDRIAAHPPYMPELEQRYIFRDGGEDGEHVTRRIIAGLPEFLRPGGRLELNCMMTDRKGARLEHRVRALLGDDAPQFDVIVAAANTFHPLEYYSALAAKGQAKFAELEPRNDVFRRLEIEHLVYGAVLVRRLAEPRPAVTVRRTLGGRAGAPALDWLLRWETLAASDPGLPARLLESRPRASSRAEVRLTHRLIEGEWTATACSVVVTEPFITEAFCPVWTPAFLARCDGSTTVRELLDFLRENGAFEPEAPPAEFLGFVRSCLTSGILELEGSAPPDGTRTPVAR